MFSLRQLIRPSVLGPSLAAAAAICGLAVWRAHVTAPVPVAVPSLSLIDELPDASWSARLTTTEEPPAPREAPEPLALRLTAADDVGDWDYRVFAFDARFPVISEDGSIAMLFEEGEDFTGAPISTLVAWSKSGQRVASFALGGNGMTGNQTANAQRMLDQANAWLARSTWRTLKEDATTTWSDDNSVQTIKPASGAPLKFEAATGTLTRGGRNIRAAFGPAGTRFPDEGEGEPGGCGDITGIERAFGSAHLLVLIPSMSYGGDSCFGAPSADVAIAVALR